MAESRAVAVVLHDVAPATWPLYAPFVAELDERFKVPLTLLVVPDYHRQGCLEKFPDFVATLDQRLARGDELVLHGYYHDDPGPLPPNPVAWFRRRILTHEGEFLTLDAATAGERIEQGLALFQRRGWPVHGFVAPAWMLGPGARQALAGLPFAYTSDPAGLWCLPGFRRRFAPTLVWSARSRWRRGVSWLWNRRRLFRYRHTALLRLGIHPVDMKHASSRHFWLAVLESLLPERVVVTKQAWLESSR